MRTECFDTDALVTIAAAFGWDGGDGVRHLAGCHACQAALRELSVVRETLAATEAPGPEFTASVLATLPARESEASEQSLSAQRDRRSALIIAVLATAGALAILLGQASTSFGIATPTTRAVSVILSLAVGAVAGWRTLRAATSG